MPFTIDEAWPSGNGQTGQSPQEELIYHVTATGADAGATGPVVQAWAEANVAETYNGQRLSDLKRARVGDDDWLMTATYGGDGNYKQTGEKSFTFNTAGGNQHITHGLQHIQTYRYQSGSGSGPGSTVTTPTAMDGFINPGKDGSVEGAEIEVAGFDFQATQYVSADDMTGDYVGLLYFLTNTVNANEFTVSIDGIEITFQPGECRFKGVTGSKRAQGDWELNLNFSALPNVTDQTIGNITGVEKRGHEYISLVSEEQKDSSIADAPFVAPVVQAVLIDQVYFEDNWVGMLVA